MSLVTIDIETEGLALNAPINYVGLYLESEDTTGYLIFDIPLETKQLKEKIEYFKDKDYKFVAHGGKFDATRLLANMGIDIYIYHDTQYLAYLMATVDELKKRKTRKYSISLEKCCERELGIPPWDIGVKNKIKKSEETKRYLEKDLSNTFRLFKHYRDILPKHLVKIYRHMIRVANAFKYIEVNGMPIDTDLLSTKLKTFEKDKDDLMVRLKRYADINYNSSQQVSHLLYDVLRLPVLKYTNKGSPSTDAATLKQLRDKHEIVELLLEYKKLDKRLTFLRSWDDKILRHKDSLNYLHATFNVDGTVSGRLSSKEPNIQQIPRDKEVKSIFRSPDPDWEFVQLDYSQLELRFAAIVADVEEMKRAYRDGEDLHTVMASHISGKPTKEISKVERTQAKAANFGYIYGMQAPSFVEYARDTYGVIFTEMEASKLRMDFFDRYPELEFYYENVENSMMNTCQVTSIMQRVYKVNPESLMDFQQKGSVLRSAINFPVQSAASDYVLCGLIEVVNDKKLAKDIRVSGSVHDSILLLIRKNHRMYENLDKIKAIMEKPKLAEQFLTKEIDIPIIVDIELGPFGLGVDVEEYKKKEAEHAEG